MSGARHRVVRSDLALLFKTTYLPCGIISVEIRHLAIEKDQIVAFTPHGLDGLDAVAHDIDEASELLEHGPRDLPIDVVIFGHEDAGSATVAGAQTRRLRGRGGWPRPGGR